MRFLQYLILFLYLSGNVLSQVVKVIDIDTEEPLEFVTLRSELPKAITVTNALGEANISSFSGSEKIYIQLLGYQNIDLSYDEIENSDFIVSLNISNISLDQVVISGTKWSQSNSEVPSKISSITSKDIEFQNPQTAADLLNISGEVYIQKSQQGGGSPMIRGFATNRVLISVDGIRMNNAIFRSGNVQNVISLDPFSIENTEVLFGPGSTIYGSDAIGGVMSFYTLRPQFSISSAPIITGHTNARYSSANDEKTGHFDINLGWENFASLTSISFSSFGNLIMGSNGPDDYLRNEYVKTQNGIDTLIINSDPKEQITTKYRQINLLQKFRYTPGQNWYFDYGLNYSTTSDYDRYDRLIRFNDGLPRSSQWYYGPQIWLMNNLSITNLSSNFIYDDFAFRLAHQYFKESRNDRDFKGIELRKRIEKVNAYSINLDFNKKINNEKRLNFGIEGVFNKVDSEGKNKNIVNGLEETGPSRYPESDWYSAGAYLVYNSKVNNIFFLQAGLRYNYFRISSKFDTTFFPIPFTSAKLENSSFTGSIGFVYQPSKTFTMGLNLSSGFRAPNVDDIGKIFDSEPGSVVVPNSNLSAESAYNIEFSIAKLFDKFLKLEFTTYYTHLDNAMVRRNFLLSGMDSIYYNGELSQVQAIQNASKAYIFGSQAGLDLSISNTLSVYCKLNFQQGEEELDNGDKSPLRHAAPLFGNAGIKYRTKVFQVELYAIYNGKIKNSDLAEEEKNKSYLYATDNNGNPYSPSWYTLNLKLGLFVFQGISINTGIENITDQRYRPYSSGIAAPGRNYIVSTKIKF